MSREMNIVMDFIKEAEKRVGKLPIGVLANLIPDFIESLEMAEIGDEVEIFVCNEGKRFPEVARSQKCVSKLHSKKTYDKKESKQRVLHYWTI